MWAIGRPQRPFKFKECVYTTGHLKIQITRGGDVQDMRDASAVCHIDSFMLLT
jgi:hypothetical protein